MSSSQRKRRKPIWDLSTPLTIYLNDSDDPEQVLSEGIASLETLHGSPSTRAPFGQDGWCYGFPDNTEVYVTSPHINELRVQAHIPTPTFESNLSESPYASREEFLDLKESVDNLAKELAILRSGPTEQDKKRGVKK